MACSAGGWTVRGGCAGATTMALPRLRCLPFTSGGSAASLAQLLPRLRSLELHEASALGGMTDDFARALGRYCPALALLEVAFERYSLASERFSDNGMIELVEGCRRLRGLTLRNCGGISDRSLYALAAYSKDSLIALELTGCSETISDYGATVLFQVGNVRSHAHPADAACWHSWRAGRGWVGGWARDDVHLHAACCLTLWQRTLHLCSNTLKSRPPLPCHPCIGAPRPAAT